MTMQTPKPTKRSLRPRGPYREATTPVRIPRSLLGAVETLLADHRRRAQTKDAA
jgi:hypothetical protein